MIEKKSNAPVIIVVVAALALLIVPCLAVALFLGAGVFKFWKATPVYMQPPPGPVMHEVDRAPAMKGSRARRQRLRGASAMSRINVGDLVVFGAALLGGMFLLIALVVLTVKAVSRNRRDER